MYSRTLEELGYISVNNEEKFSKNIIIFDEIQDDELLTIIMNALQDRINVYYHTRDHRDDYKQAKTKEKADIRAWRTKQKKLTSLNGEIPQYCNMAPTKEPIRELLTDMASNYLSKPYTNEIEAIINSI